MAYVVVPIMTGVAQIAAASTISATAAATKLTIEVAMWAGEKTVGALWWYAWGKQREEDAYRAIVREELQRQRDAELAEAAAKAAEESK